jgi:hypothetical protein
MPKAVRRRLAAHLRALLTRSGGISSITRMAKKSGGKKTGGAKGGKKKVIHRSAKSGRFVSERAAKRLPASTVKETVDSFPPIKVSPVHKKKD